MRLIKTQGVVAPQADLFNSLLVDSEWKVQKKYFLLD
jgi:hypothetical protein